MANLALFLGLCMSYSIPINKKIWTSSYVLLTAGLAMHMLAMCYWLIDMKGVERWAWPFMVFGTNAILVYVASGIVGRILIFTKLPAPEGSPIMLKTWIYQHVFTPTFTSPYNASLAYALTYVLTVAAADDAALSQAQSS